MTSSRREFLINSALLTGSATLKLSPTLEKHLEIDGADKLILLGTQGGPVIRSYRSSPSASAIFYKNIPYVVDTGYGVSFKLVESGIPLISVNNIFISHHHSDHNLELGPLLYNCWVGGAAKPINVYAPTGLKTLIDFYWKSNQFDIETRIADEDRPDIRKLVIANEYTQGPILTDSEISVFALRNIHPPIKESYALKFVMGNKTVVFSGDTAFCPALAEFAFEAEYLVHEIMYPAAIDELIKRRPNAKKLKESILSHHTSAEDVGRLANMAKVKNLIINHFVPPDDKKLTDQVWVDPIRNHFKGNIIVGKDFLQLPL